MSRRLLCTKKKKKALYSTNIYIFFFFGASILQTCIQNDTIIERRRHPYYCMWIQIRIRTVPYICVYNFARDVLILIPSIRIEVFKNQKKTLSILLDSKVAIRIADFSR